MGQLELQQQAAVGNAARLVVFALVEMVIERAVDQREIPVEVILEFFLGKAQHIELHDT